MENFKLTESEDGKGFHLEWDETDPELAFLNGLTDKQIETMIRHAIYLAAHPDETDISEHFQQIEEQETRDI
jgi:hypothetical protein